MPLQTRGNPDHSERRHPNPYTGNQLTSPSESLPKRPTTEVQKACGQQHGRVALCLVRELALDCSSPQPSKKPTERGFNFNYHDFLIMWNKMIDVTRLGNFIPPLVPYMARPQRTVHRRCPWYPHEKGDAGTRPAEVRSQRVSIRKTGEAPQILPPAASSLPSLRPEVRKRVTQGDFRRQPDHKPSNASRSVNLFLPRRPRGAYFVVLSSVACKVGRRFRQRGFLAGWYHPN